MREDKILYQIKTLDKVIIRNFIKKHKNDKVENLILLPPTQMQIIEYIIKSKCDTYQKDLENILRLRRATVSGVLQTMEKNNLIERIIDNNDTRIKKIILKDKAKKIFFEKEKELYELEEKMINGISKEDLDNFSEVLKRLIKNLSS